MERHAVRLAATAGVFCVLVVGGCSQPIRAPEQSPSPDRGARSQAALEELVVAPDTEPGCSAAVGERGRVLWQGQAGLAVLQPATPITAETTFHIGSVSKQFTALAAALLAEDGRLSLDDTVAEHLDGYPDWAEQVTLSQLIHHTSGIPEVINLMRLRGTEPDTKASREDLLEAIREAETLDFEPGSQWAYSNSNYLLLGLIVEQTSGRPLATHLAQTFFAPLDLTMALEPPGSSPTGTRSYRANEQGQFEVVDWPWDLSGPTGIWATPTDLIRWADVYRTGVVGGELVTKPQTDAVAGADGDSRYGLGILIAPNGVLWHNGIARGFNTEFVVSANRDRAIAVSCNGNGIEPATLVEALGPIWQVW